MLGLIDDINSFAGELAKKEIVTVGQDKITVIAAAGEMISQLKSVTENIKATIGNAEGTELMNNISNPIDVIKNGVNSLLDRGNGGYVSSIGGSL